MKKYEIWVGNYHLGQGYESPNKPTLLKTIEAPSFKVACYLYELEDCHLNIKELISSGDYISDQDLCWFYDIKSNSNSWTGRYFETREEAEETFKK